MYGPLARPLQRLFGFDGSNSASKESKKKAKRFMTQLAPRLCGAVFLARMFPIAFRVLADPKISADRMYGVSDESIQTMTIALGYFIYDIIVVISRYSDNGGAYVLHGIVCSLAYAYAAFSGHIHRYGTMFLMWEISTPWLYIRWMLLKAGLAESRWLTMVNTLFMLSFIGCRNIYGPIMGWDFFKNSYPDFQSGQGDMPRPILLCYYIAFVTLNTLNYFWLSQMISAVLGIRKQIKVKEA